MTDARPAAAADLPPVRNSLLWVGGLTAVWAVLLVAGFVVLRRGDALAAMNRVSPERAAFVSANVAALAGFSMDFAKPADFSGLVRFVFVLQTFAGLLLSLVGGGILWARLLGRPYSDARLIVTAIAMIAIAIAGGAVTVRPNETIGAAAFRGVSALGCGGVTFGEPARPGPVFSLILAPLSLLGALGVVVVNDVVRAVQNRIRLPGHTARALTLVAALYVLSIVVGARSLAEGWPSRLVAADARFLSALTLGLPMASVTAGLSLATLLPILLIGTGTAGSAGAIGLGWLVTAPARVRPVVMNALTAQAMLAAATLAELAHFEPTLPTERRLLVAASAVMNAGLSHEPLSITGIGLAILAVSVIAAKLLPLIVFALALMSPKKEPL